MWRQSVFQCQVLSSFCIVIVGFFPCCFRVKWREIVCKTVNKIPCFTMFLWKNGSVLGHFRDTFPSFGSRNTFSQPCLFDTITNNPLKRKPTFTNIFVGGTLHIIPRPPSSYRRGTLRLFSLPVLSWLIVLYASPRPSTCTGILWGRFPVGVRFCIGFGTLSPLFHRSTSGLRSFLLYPLDLVWHPGRTPVVSVGFFLRTNRNGGIFFTGSFLFPANVLTPVPGLVHGRDVGTTRFVMKDEYISPTRGTVPNLPGVRDSSTDY